jgi:AcrR family transcriptional regulator
MTTATDVELSTSILDAVLELLERDGYDAVVLREVARRARVSLSTIYKLFPTGANELGTREELIVCAVERWIGDAYSAVPLPSPDVPLYDRLMTLIRYIIAPWEQSPRMLEALDRARGGPAEWRLTPRIAEAVEPLRVAAYAGCDEQYSADVDLVLALLLDALIRRFADGQLGVADIPAILERAVTRLAANALPMDHAPRDTTGPARASKTRQPG